MSFDRDGVGQFLYLERARERLKLVLPLTEGVIPHRAPDKSYPEVRVQGSVRAKNANGDRLVTITARGAASPSGIANRATTRMPRTDSMISSLRLVGR